MELILADLQQAQNSAVKLEKQAKGNRELVPVLEMLKKVINHLDGGEPVRTFEMTEEEKGLLKPYPFLTNKRVSLRSQCERG